MIPLLLIFILYTSYIYLYADQYLNFTSLIGWEFLIIYLTITSLFIVKFRKVTLFNPEFLFFIVFFFCTFLYFPLLYDSKIDTFLFGKLSKETSLNLIKTQSIAILSILFYLIGAVLVSFRKVDFNANVTFSKSDEILIKKKKVIHIITTILILISTLSGGWKLIYRYKENSVGLEEIGSFFQYVTIFLVISTILEFIELNKHTNKSFLPTLKKINYLYLFNMFAVLSLYTISGYRSAIFQIVIPFVFLYDLTVKKINKSVLIIMVFLSFISMSILKDSRAGIDTKLSANVFSLEYLGGDFIGANQAMFFLVDYTDRNGNQNGKNTVLHISSFMPFLQTIIIDLFGFEASKVSSEFFTEQIENTWGGLGTHVIGDLYYSYGFLGTILCMFTLGMISSRLYLISTYGSGVRVWKIAIYLIILGNSLMFPRVEFFSIIRSIGFSILILWFLKRCFSVNIT